MENKNFVPDLVAILVKNKALSSHEAKAMVDNFANQSDIDFDEFVLSEGLISKEDLLLALSELYEVPAVDVTGYFFDTGLVKSIPKDFLLHYGVIPLEVEENIMTVVAFQPDMPGLDSKLEEFGSYVIEFRVGLLRDILDVVRDYYDEEIVTTDGITGQEAEDLIEEDELGELPDESI
jgi:hypothetical protein